MIAAIYRFISGKIQSSVAPFPGERQIEFNILFDLFLEVFYMKV